MLYNMLFDLIGVNNQDGIIASGAVVLSIILFVIIVDFVYRIIYSICKRR